VIAPLAEGLSGPVGVTSVALRNRRLPLNFRYAPSATEVVRRRKMSPSANSRHGCRLTAQPACYGIGISTPADAPSDCSCLLLKE
jgi:hypothetical protein